MLDFITLTDNDIPILQDMAKRIWYDSFPAFLSNEQIAYMLDMMYADDPIRRDIANGYEYELIYDTKELIGYIAVKRHGEEDFLLLSKLYIAPEYHGKGYGQKALHYTERIANDYGVSEIRLYVNRQNARAIKAYKKFGFQIIDERAHDIGNAFIMHDYLMARHVFSLKR